MLSSVTLPLGFRLFSFDPESSAMSLELLFLIGLLDEGRRLKLDFEPEFPTDGFGMEAVPLPPTGPMPARSEFGCFLAVLFELLKAKF